MLCVSADQNSQNLAPSRGDMQRLHDFDKLLIERTMSGFRNDLHIQLHFNFPETRYFSAHFWDTVYIVETWSCKRPACYALNVVFRHRLLFVFTWCIKHKDARKHYLLVGSRGTRSWKKRWTWRCYISLSYSDLQLSIEISSNVQISHAVFLPLTIVTALCLYFVYQIIATSNYLRT